MTPRRRLASWTLASMAALSVLALAAGCASGGIAAGAGSPTSSQPAPGPTADGPIADGPTADSPTVDGPTVAFYGDSYTLGTGASGEARRWSTIISAERGWNEVNPSVNGLGFVNHRDALPGPDLVDQVIAAKPDIVIVTMGLNDNFSMPERADDIRSAISNDFTALTTALPHARLIVVEPFWYTDERSSSVERIIGWVKAAAGRAGADYIPGASHWIEGHPEWMAGDGLHPNDTGYRAMAERMDAELGKLGL